MTNPGETSPKIGRRKPGVHHGVGGTSDGRPNHHSSLELRSGRPSHQSLARSFGARPHPVEHIGGKGDHGSPVAHSSLDLVAGMELQLAAFIMRRIGELHRNGKLAPRLYISLVHVPVVMAILTAMIDRILERLGKAAEI